jgi:predicted transglutaminase-like cysteine proteinase
LQAYPLAERIQAINNFVNERVRFTEDRREFHSDLWQSASNTLRRRRGDCEDYAIAKLQLLRAAGVNSDDIYLVIARDLIRRADHAVVVVRGGSGMMLLDNGTDAIGDATQDQSYRPVLSFSASGRAWTHGYQRPPELQIAEAKSSTVAAAAAVTGALR